MPTHDRVVWSSETGPVRQPATSNPPEPRPAADPAAKQTARLLRERKGRGGKIVTLIQGLTLRPDELEALARDLRRACSTGGTVKGDVIELQGDQRERLSALLEERGYRVKLVGG